jgi:hypothetical protein
MNSPALLTDFERCDRKGYWSRSHERIKLDDTEMLQAAIRAGVTEDTRKDWGEAAGEECYALGLEPGLETTHYDVYGEVTHLACIADIVTTAIRKPGEQPWKRPEPVQLRDGPMWTSGAYLSPDGGHLRRIVLASSWSDDRHYSECRSWFSLGEICAYGLPMQQVVIVLGQRRNGKRHGYWSKGLRHPANKKLRFRKKHDVSTGFKSTWLQIWREDYDDIPTLDWLQAMLEDGVLQDVCFNVEIPVPEKDARQMIVDLATRKLEKIQNLDSLPDQNLSTCDWPSACLFRSDCHANRSPNKGMFRIIEPTAV